MFDASSRSVRSVRAIAIAAALVGATGVGITAHALLADEPAHAPMVRALEPRELPAGIPPALAPDAVATRPVVGLLDSLRHMDQQPRGVDWVHFRCVEAATVLSAEPEGNPTEYRARLVQSFPPSWQRTVGKDADYMRSPDGSLEIAIPEASGRDAVDALAAALRPARVIALAYHLRPC